MVDDEIWVTFVVRITLQKYSGFCGPTKLNLLIEVLTKSIMIFCCIYRIICTFVFENKEHYDTATIGICAGAG